MADSNGDISTGTGFHVGDGILVTAKHVAEQNVEKIVSEATGGEIGVLRTFFHPDAAIDLAVLETDFLQKMPASHGKKVRLSSIPLGQYLDDWLGDDFILSKVLVMGYPKIPRAKSPFLVSAEAEVNAQILKYDGHHTHFILSSTARGGFSGGPVISSNGYVLGVITESLVTQGDKGPEAGFFAAISVEPLLQIFANRGGERPPFIADDVWDLIRKKSP